MLCSQDAGQRNQGALAPTSPPVTAPGCQRGPRVSPGHPAPASRRGCESLQITGCPVAPHVHPTRPEVPTCPIPLRAALLPLPPSTSPRASCLVRVRVYTAQSSGGGKCGGGGGHACAVKGAVPVRVANSSLEARPGREQLPLPDPAGPGGPLKAPASCAAAPPSLAPSPRTQRRPRAAGQAEGHT